MISKCIRRLSFRSLADDAEEKAPKDANNNGIKEPRFPAPVAVKPSWTSGIWDRSPAKSDGARDNGQTVPMSCSVYLQQNLDTHIVCVVLHRADRGILGLPHGDIVASSAVSINIQHGKFKVLFFSIA
jgi:hypothetical protein